MNWEKDIAVTPAMREVGGGAEEPGRRERPDDEEDADEEV